MFEIRNVRTTVKLIANADYRETVYAVDLFCETCGLKLDDTPLDLWLTIGFPVVLSCPRCLCHIVVNFSSLDKEIDQIDDPSSL